MKSPSRICTYLGFELDTIRMQVRLPNQRITRLMEELQFWKGPKKATQKQLQVLTGHLVHCASVIQGGNVYMYHILSALRESKEKRRVKIRKEFHTDIWWWSNFASNFNHRSMKCATGTSICHELSMFTGYKEIKAQVANTCTTLEWPCVYVWTDGDKSCIPMFAANDKDIGYGNNEEGLGMYLPNQLLFDNVGMEICALLVALQKNHDWSNCVKKLLFSRKLTYLCLKKFRSKQVMLLCVFKHIFWWLVHRNVYLEVIYAHRMITDTLRDGVVELCKYAWASSTSKTRDCQWRKYASFCDRVNIPQLPISCDNPPIA